MGSWEGRRGGGRCVGGRGWCVMLDTIRYDATQLRVFRDALTMDYLIEQTTLD